MTEFKGRYDKLIDALFDAYCDEDNDHPQDIKDSINDTINYFSNALHTTPAKVDSKIMTPMPVSSHRLNMLMLTMNSQSMW